MYFVPPRYNPVGARDPGSSKSVIIAVISSGLNCIEKATHQQMRYVIYNHRKNSIELRRTMIIQKIKQEKKKPP